MSQHNPHTRSGNKVLSNGEPIDDVSFIALHEDRVGDFSILNNHYRLQSLDYFTLVKTARPEVHEDVAERSKKLSFFTQNDPLWNSVIDTRLADLRAYAAARAVP